jgi:site-specific DNA-methyltransferase (adenine-specific)
MTARLHDVTPAGIPASLTPRLRAPAIATALGAVYEGDNLGVLERLAELEPESVALAYCDPPFFTGRDFGAFTDRWDSLRDYVDAFGLRAAECYRLLMPEGRLVVHVDWRVSAYLRVELDKCFGREAFDNEIVWRYRRMPTAQPRFQRVHDTLLVYRKDRNIACRWTQPYEPLAASTVATWGTKKQTAVVRDGRRVRSSVALEESPGVAMGDVWDIPILAPLAAERTGYPTQKPEALLRRLVEAFTLPGDTVLDPYAGSGTTLVAAAKLGRRFVGVDASPKAIDTMRARLLEPPACA